MMVEEKPSSIGIEIFESKNKPSQRSSPSKSFTSGKPRRAWGSKPAYVEEEKGESPPDEDFSKAEPLPDSPQKFHDLPMRGADHPLKMRTEPPLSRSRQNITSYVNQHS